MCYMLEWNHLTAYKSQKMYQDPCNIHTHPIQIDHKTEPNLIQFELSSKTAYYPANIKVIEVATRSAVYRTVCICQWQIGKYGMFKRYRNIRYFRAHE